MMRRRRAARERRVTTATLAVATSRAGWAGGQDSQIAPLPGRWRVARAARRLLLLSLAMNFGGLLQPLYQVFANERIPYLFTGIQYLSLPVAYLALVRYRRSYPLQFPTPTFDARRRVLFAATLLLVIYGLWRENLPVMVVQDAWTFLFLFVFLDLSRYDPAWLDVEKPLIVLFWLLFITVLAGLGLPRPMIWEDGGIELEHGDLSSRPFVFTLAYPLARLLEFWPLVFVFAYLRPRFDTWKLLGLLAALGWVAVQILFQKRAPVLRGVCYLVAALMMVPYSAGRMRTLAPKLLLVGGGLVILVLFSGTASFVGLVQRYQDFKEEGLAEARIEESQAMLKDFSDWDNVVGRGMGGWYVPPLEMTGSPVSSQGEIGNPSTHIGFFHPFIKGGILLSLLYYSFFASLLRRKPRWWLQNRCNAAALCIAPVLFLFLFMEGAPNPGNIALGLVTAFACGRGGVIGSGSEAAPSVTRPQTRAHGSP